MEVMEARNAYYYDCDSIQPKMVRSKSHSFKTMYNLSKLRLSINRYSDAGTGNEIASFHQMNSMCIYIKHFFQLRK